MRKPLPFASALPLALVAVLAPLANASAATVNFPYIDVITIGTPTNVTQTGGLLSVTATADAIVTALGTQTALTPIGTFTLTGTYSAALTAADGAPNTYDYTTGTLSVNNGTNLLTASFSDLRVSSLSTSLYSIAIGSGSLVYSGGTLAGALTQGEIVGSFTVSSFTPNGNGQPDLSQDFTGTNFTAKVGSVVPLPGSLTLVLPALLGLGALTRRRAAVAA